MTGAISDLTEQQVIDLLKLRPHPEGGYYRETYRDSDSCDGSADGRACSTAIYYLLGADDCSAWHRVDAVEVWHFYAGSPLALTLSTNGHDATSYRLGNNLPMGEHPQIVVPKRAWQTAESLGPWTLVGCTVAPGFDFAGFEMAPPDWRPTPRTP